MRVKVALRNGADRLRRRAVIATGTVEPDGQSPTFGMGGRSSIQEGSYTISNHHPFYYLMPLDQADAAASRERAWAALEDYHEHRDPEAQNPEANRVSRWIVEEVLAPLNAATFLEVGCGAGRNLKWLAKTLPEAEFTGFDVHDEALERAASAVPGASLHLHSAYQLDRYPDSSFDVVYSVGVLEHLPHERVEGVVREMHRVASKAVVHFELHGPSSDFDYHRYPRDYGALYASLALDGTFEYTVFPDDDFRSAGVNFNHALVTATLA